MLAKMGRIIICYTFVFKGFNLWLMEDLEI